LLIVDDDTVFRKRLARAMEKRGFDVFRLRHRARAWKLLASNRPPLPCSTCAWPMAAALMWWKPCAPKAKDCRIIMLTGYGNITTAVAAVKAGAVDYLSKPTDADAIEQALLANGTTLPPPPENPMSADRVRWEHINRVYEQCDRNVSETARRLKMHRRTLQRILAKHAPKDNSGGLDD
jgi:two-component system response regulator RegA